MKILITGASGFVGGHVARACADAGWDVLRQDILGGADTYSFDLCDREPLIELLRAQRPDACVHLAGIAFVPAGWDNPQDMYRVNLLATVNLLEAFRTELPKVKFLFASTAHVYDAVDIDAGPTEKIRLKPSSIYAISKLAADLTVISYAQRYGMQAMVARPINHIGPGQSDRFVVSSFARQLKLIAAGRRAPLMKVGNLSSQRDFLDVRDVARAYTLLIEKGVAGGHYDIASGKLASIQSVLDELCSVAGVDPQIERDPDLYRPTDNSPILDTGRLRKCTGWEPQIGLSQSLQDIYESIQI